MKKLISLLLTVVMITSLCAPAYAAVPLDGYPGIDDLPASDTIPNPFKFFDTKNDPTDDGYVSTPEEWQNRREEIKDIVQHYWLGYQWETAQEDVSGGWKTLQDPNTVTVNGATINLGEEFEALLDLVKTKGVTVGENTYGPEENEAAAKQAAVDAWNAGYTVTKQVFSWWTWTMEDVEVRLADTGTITVDTIPSRTKPVDHVVVTVKNPDTDVEASFVVSITAPTSEQREQVWGDADAQVPAVIDIGGAAAFSAANLNPQGYALISFTPTDIYADDSSAGDGIDRSGVYTTLYPYNKDEYKYASGALLAWAWGVSRIIDALSNKAVNKDVVSDKTFGQEWNVDPTRTVVTGHSRYGKSAMFAAAFDDRISICCPSEPGGSGIQSNRYKVEGKIFNWNTSYYPKADRVYGRTETPTVSYGSGNSWFPETAAMFVDKDNQIPFDSDEIIALVAPRPFFVVSGIDTHWLGNEGGVASVKAAAEVYDYIGTNEIEKNNIAIRCRQSDHAFYPQDFCFALAIMDREFKQDETDTTLHVQDLFPNGGTNMWGQQRYDYSTFSYPAADYDTVSEMTSHPFEISSYYMPWSSANKYMLWTAQDNFLTDHDVTITAHSDAPDVELYTPDGIKINAASHSGEVFTFELPKAQAVYGRYELRTVGTEKENRSTYFSAISLSDALRHGTTKGDEGEENRVLGFSSRLTNTSENPPEVYIDGEKTTMSFTASRMKEEETTLLSYGIQFHDPLFVRIANEGWDETKTFSVKNLQFVTLPGYTFEFSMADIYASAENSGKEGAANFTKAISWPVERYNNGEAEVWPQIPDTAAEREILALGGQVVRPEAPEKWTTAFDAEVTGTTAVKNDAGDLVVTVSFSEELNKGEYAFGMDVATKWETTWNEAGDQMIITIPAGEVPSNAQTMNLIIFRLMDKKPVPGSGEGEDAKIGNLISGPMELTVDLPYTPAYVPGVPSAPSTPSTTVTAAAAEHGTVALSSTTAKAGETVTVTVKADDGYEVDTVVVTDKNGAAVDVTASGEGTYTFVVPAAVPATVTVTFKQLPASAKFKDVDQNKWYSDAIAYVVENGLMNGVSDTEFNPNGTITRGMLVTILHRLAGEPDAAKAPFTDVDAGQYYAAAVNWAAANGIVNGITDTTFAPNAPITREQLAALLYRYAAYKGYDTTASADLTDYVDAAEVSSYAEAYLSWAVAEKLINGRDNATLAPADTASRAEAATILMRFCETVAK